MSYIRETVDVLRNRVTVHKQQIRDPHTGMLGVSKHIDECAAGLTPQFTIFPFYKILSPSEVMRKNKERFFILKYRPLMIWNYANCSRALWITRAITIVIIMKITISSIVIGLKNSYFPLIHLPSCYRTVCYRTVRQTNHIQSCSLNQPITFKVVV